MSENGADPAKDPLGGLIRRLIQACREEPFQALATASREAIMWQEAGHTETDTLKKLRNLARAQLALEEIQEALEAAKTVVVRRYQALTEQIIPEVMSAAEVSEVTLGESHRLILAQTVRANLPKDRADEGCDWLIEHGDGAIVSHTVTVTLGRAQDEMASKVEAACKELGVDFERRRGVHPSTMSSWAREALKSGREFDPELFGLFTKTASKIEEKRSKA